MANLRQFLQLWCEHFALKVSPSSRSQVGNLTRAMENSCWMAIIAVLHVHTYAEEMTSLTSYHSFWIVAWCSFIGQQFSREVLRQMKTMSSFPFSFSYSESLAVKYKENNNSVGFSLVPSRWPGKGKSNKSHQGEEIHRVFIKQTNKKPLSSFKGKKKLSDMDGSKKTKDTHTATCQSACSNENADADNTK